MDWWRIVCCAAAGYLLGSCNGAIVVSHTCMHDDIRKKGSGNAGLTNFLRNFGGWATLLVVLMDMGKVVLACLLGRWLLPGNPQLGMMIAGAMTELGHIFPVFYGFRGGKGILSGGTIVLMLDWRVALVAWGLFVVLWLSTKYVSLGSIAATASMPVTTFFVFSHNVLYTVLSAAIAALVIWCHRGNIQRLLSGTEKKFKWHVNPIREDDGK